MPSKRFDGWKAIATYMNRSVRQCQRLTETSDLPVRNLPASRAVFAYEHELESWISGGKAPEGEVVEAQLSSSGQHVILPVSAAVPAKDATPVGQQAAPPPTPAPATTRQRTARWPLMVLGSLVLGFVILALILQLRWSSEWRARGTPLIGSWTFAEGGLMGQAPGVGRYDTAMLMGPGASASATLRTEGERWSGGLEIFDDDLHWTFVSISPRQHAIDIQRFPAGTVTTVFAGPEVATDANVSLTVALHGGKLEVANGSNRLTSIRLDPWDVSRGRLMLRVGSPGDELHDSTGGCCRFTHVEVHGQPKSIPATTCPEVPPALRPAATYELSADTIDDQLDVLIDNLRVAVGGYDEQIGPLTLNPFLTRGRHILTALLFNRKWTAAYHLFLRRNGHIIWEKACGTVGDTHTECPEIGHRLGMVKKLSYTFDAE